MGKHTYSRAWLAAASGLASMLALLPVPTVQAVEFTVVNATGFAISCEQRYVDVAVKMYDPPSDGTQGYSVTLQLAGGLRLAYPDPTQSNPGVFIDNFLPGNWTFGSITSGGAHPTVVTLPGAKYQVSDMILTQVNGVPQACSPSGIMSTAPVTLFTVRVRASKAGEFIGTVSVIASASQVLECATLLPESDGTVAALSVDVERPLPDISAIDLVPSDADEFWYAWTAINENTTADRIGSVPNCGAAGGGSIPAGQRCFEATTISVCPECGTSDIVVEFLQPRDLPSSSPFYESRNCWYVSVYRARHNNYPWFDDTVGGDVGGNPPLSPAYPPPSVWTLVQANAPSPLIDRVGSRDEWYYVAFLLDEFGNVSGPSPLTGLDQNGDTFVDTGTLNYQLGDVIRPVLFGTVPREQAYVGDGEVTGQDFAFLGQCMGLVRPFEFIPNNATVSNRDCKFCDIGPTRFALDPVGNAVRMPRGEVGVLTGGDFVADKVVGLAYRPQTDGKIDVNDFGIMAIQFQLPSKPTEPPAPAESDEIAVEAAHRVMPGEEFTANVMAKGAGHIQTLSVTLKWDPSVVEPVRDLWRSKVAAGELLQSQSGLALSSAPGTVDVALLGRRETGLSGEGLLATMHFKAVGEGDPMISIASVDAKDHDLRPLDVAVNRPSETMQGTVKPRVTDLHPGVPNPFNPATTISFSLAQSGKVDLSIYSVTGRRVKTLVQGSWTAGNHEVGWDGTDDQNLRVPTGIYYVRLVTADVTRSRSLALVK